MATAKSRKERVEIARSRDILSVADELGMELVRTGQDFRWKEHDSLIITPKKNVWKWFSRDQGGDVIALVETMKEINFNQAIDYLNDGDFKVYDASQKLETQEPFSYYLQRYEKPFDEARTYLKAERGLTDETIDFFLDKGVLAQANAKLGDSIEPVIVFKTLSSSGEVVGGNLQGIRENWDKWPKRGYAKNIIRNSEEMNGLHIDIGQPTRLVFTESPIDLMSYYQLHKDTLDNVRLVSMDGLKEVSISRHLVQLEAELQGRSFEINDSTGEALENLARMTDYFQGGKHAEMITLAVDQDEHGLEFIQKLQEKGITVKPDLPDLQPGRDKTDWNDYLKFQNEPKNDNSRLAQARRKLDRLNNEFLDATDAVYNLSAMTNGQPMNDKRDGSSFFKKMDQLENRVFDKLDEIRQQEARVERLEAREERKAAGLNRSGNGLEMSVQNIPRIREEIEKAKRGESTYRSETIRRYQEELQRLEGISEKMSSLTIQPGAQALINDGTVNQWAKQPNIYFVKGLRRVAVELSDDGNFIESSKYRPKTPEERERLMQILKSQVSSSPAEPELRVVFDFTENLTIGKHYSKGDNIPYKDFVNILYQENTLQSFRAEGGYDKTYFDLQNEAGEILVKNIRFDVGSERETLAKQLETVLPEKYLELAQNAEIPEKQEESKKAPDQNQEQENQTNSAKKEVKNSIAQRVSEILSATNEKPENREELPQSVPSAEKENKATNLSNENNSFDYYKASAQDLSDQAIQKIRDYMRSPEELKEYMDFMSKFPNLSPRNIALIREQWPGADAVATFEQWRQIGRSLGITPDDVIPVEATFENKRTGNKKEISNDQLSVKFGERSKITLFRPAMIEMIPVFNEQGYQVINEKGNPKFKPKSQASPEERKKIKNKEIKVVEFQARDQNGRPKFNPYKVFELSQTNLKPEAYPKAIPNRHYNFNLDKVRTKEVLAGLNDYARKIQVSIAWNEERFIGNSKGVFLPIEQKIILNKSNTPGENISTAIHELAHATLHNPQKDYKKELSQDRKELEAELTSYLVSKHFGLDTSQKSIVYMAAWTDNLRELSDSDLSQSLTRIHKTTAKIIESVERHTTPFQPNHQLRLNASGPEFSRFPPSRGMKI